MPVIRLINGCEGAALDPLDRGAQYGDGVFRTLRVARERPQWLEAQLAKLGDDAARLGIDAPDTAAWRADLAKLDGRLSGGVLKLLLTRGIGARGYRPPSGVTPTRIVIHDSTPPPSDQWPATGLNLRVCEFRLAEQTRLAGIKHLNRLENVLARAEWDDPEIHEGLLRDASGRVISGVMSNLLLWRNGRLLTPRLDRCGVAGVTRARLMRHATAAGFAVEESELGLDEVMAADELMLCNSLIGLRRVARLGARAWPDTEIYDVLHTLLDAE
ncbi:MAG: aminodeoxychorismate lyase [Pseudomonadota bacterium]|nr:aminodeoxychorismate lyase [Pseudomonadota bacterium]MDP1904674.1 aminodeoxychorismate lyase [Pseudomonadota bacterium]MDP2352865.1 aminodeoxychorismate lyase [Pseudomonadota bacterium]